MKKVLLMIGVIAMLTACGNKSKTEVTIDATDSIENLVDSADVIEDIVDLGTMETDSTLSAL